MIDCEKTSNVTECKKISLIITSRMFSFKGKSSAELYLKTYLYSVILKRANAQTECLVKGCFMF